MTSTYNDGLTISLYSVAFNDVPKHSALRKFGETICLVAGTEYTIANLLAPATRVAKLTTHEKVNIVSTSALDTSAGTGARTLYLSGLDQEFKLKTETITMNGTTPVQTVNSYIHIRDCYNLTCGSTSVNQGNISFITATTSSFLGLILALQGGFKSNVYVVPKGLKAQYTLHNCSNERAGGVNSIIQARLLLWNKTRTAYREHLKIHIDQELTDWRYLPLPHGIILTEGECAEWIVSSNQNNTPVRLISHLIEREA